MCRRCVRCSGPSRRRRARATRCTRSRATATPTSRNMTENGKADRVEKFMAGAQAFIKHVVSDFDNYDFYTGSSEKLDGSIVLAYWEDESASGPVFYLFNDCLKEIK